MIRIKRHIEIALCYFILAVSLGLVLRFFVVFDLPITYKFFVHTHSHIALLGWVYLVLTTLIYKQFQTTESDKKYSTLFWFTNLSLIGMLLTFPFQGYAFFSIIFSTLFLFASYLYYAFFLKYAATKFRNNNFYKCIKVALLYMVISSIGPWALGAIMNTLGVESVWYRLSIYFYLHFQYNGWMILALVGLFFLVLERLQINISPERFKRFFWMLNLGIVLSFFLSTLFTKPPVIFYVLGGSGALLQLTAFAFLFRIFKGSTMKSNVCFSPFQKGLLKMLLVLWGIKMLLQLLTAIPYFANLAVSTLDFTIGYLHWTFLGVITIGVFFFLDYYGLLKISKKAYAIYLVGFFMTEGLIFYRGIAGWQNLELFFGYSEMLVSGSFLIGLALLLMLVVNMRAVVKQYPVHLIL